MEDFPETNITKKIKTETAHIVRNAFSKKCAYSIHGHSYIWEFTFAGNIDKNDGMIIDFGRMKDLKEEIGKLDHATVFWSKEDKEIIDFFKQNFNRVIIMKKNPTAENMARLGYKIAKDWVLDNSSDTAGFDVYSVTVHETDTGRATSYGCDNNDIIKEGYEENG